MLLPDTPLPLPGIRQSAKVCQEKKRSACICAGDHSAWDREEIFEMLDIFLNITEAITLPDPKEYYWRNDKVADLPCDRDGSFCC